MEKRGKEEREKGDSGEKECRRLYAHILRGEGGEPIEGEGRKKKEGEAAVSYVDQFSPI